jgi:AraC-like DNA-binding protein
MLLVDRGALRLECTGRSFTLLPGSLLLVPPRVVHRILVGPDAAFHGFSFATSLIDPLALDSAGEPVFEDMGLAGSTAAAPRIERLPPAEYREASSLFQSLTREAGEKRPGHEAMVRLRLMEAILLLYRARRGTERARDGAPLRFHLAEVQRFLQERFADELTLPGIAARYGLNPSYFSRLFHKEAGVSLVAYINRLRIQRSCQLLKRTRISILEIALSVGYNNISHFNRYFRRIMGMSPREYRAQAEK